MSSAPAPGSPVSPVMAPGPKDAVTIGLGTGRIWATMGQGILNEVYWPTAGEPQIRDMDFIVAGDGWWSEVKAVAARRHPGHPERHRPQGTPLDRRRQPQRPLLQRAIRRAGHHQARRLLHEQPCRCRHHARPGCVRLRRPDRMHQTHDGRCSSRAAAFDGHTHAVLDGPAISKPAGSVASSRNAPAD